MAILAVASLVLVAGCGGSGGPPTASIPAASDSSSSNRTTASAGDGAAEPVTLVATDGEFRSPAQADRELHPEVSIKTNFGTIEVKLNWEQAPRTVANFLYNYVETGFYDQTLIHYVDNGYLIAGGGYSVSMQQKPTQPPIPCEANNHQSNRRGTIAMARHPEFVNSATSQFFINLVDNPGLDCRPGENGGVNGYCVFGEVLAGMDVVDRIAQVAVHNQGEVTKTPVQPVIIESVTRTK